MWARRDGCVVAVEYALGRPGGAQHALLIGPEGCGKYAAALRALARLDECGGRAAPEEIGVGVDCERKTAAPPVQGLGLRSVELRIGPRRTLSLVRSRVHVDLDVSALAPYAHKAAIQVINDTFSRDADLVIVLRRAHELSEDAQESLRCIIERPGGTLRFWLTARSGRGRILAPIASRLTPFHMTPPSRDTLIGALVAGAPQPTVGAVSSESFAPMAETDARVLVDAAGGRLTTLFKSLRERALREAAARAAPPGAEPLRSQSPTRAIPGLIASTLDAARRAGAPTDDEVEALQEGLAAALRSGARACAVLDDVVDALCAKAGRHLGAASAAEVAQAAFELSDVLHRSETPLVDLVSLCVQAASRVGAPSS